MTETLNPRLDVVFKLLLAPKRNRGILIALLNDVLQPKQPIASVEVMNPEIKKETVNDRGIFLDIPLSESRRRRCWQRGTLTHRATLQRSTTKRPSAKDSLKASGLVLRRARRRCWFAC